MCFFDLQKYFDAIVHSILLKKYVMFGFNNGVIHTTSKIFLIIGNAISTQLIIS